MNRVLISAIAGAMLFPLAAVAAGDREVSGSNVDLVDLSSPSGEPGILVASVVDDSPAEKAGLMRGDILLEVESSAVNTVGDLRDLLSGYEGGDIVDVLISRGGEERMVQVDLETRLYRPAFGIEEASGGRFQFAPGGRGFSIHPDLPNFPLGDRSFTFRFYGDEGIFGDVVMSVEENSPADRAGIVVGDIISRVGDLTLDERTVASAIGDLSPNDIVDIELQRPTDEERSEVVVVTVTLGSNDEGDAYLGIGFMPLRMMRFDDMFQGRRGDPPRRIPRGSDS